MKAEKRINYHDTDAIGIVYHGAYLNFLEESRTRLLEEKGVSVKNMHEKGKYFVVKAFKIDYKHPARYGDIITCETSINKVTAAQIYFSQTIFNKPDKTLLAASEVVLVVVNKDLNPIVLPKTVDLLIREEMEV